MTRKVPYPTRGEILLQEFMVPMGLSKYRLAQAIRVSATRIGEIVAGERAITANTGLRLSRFFGLNDGFWVGLQADYDVAKARDVMGNELDEIEAFTAAQ